MASCCAGTPLPPGQGGRRVSLFAHRKAEVPSGLPRGCTHLAVACTYIAAGTRFRSFHAWPSGLPSREDLDRVSVPGPGAAEAGNETLPPYTRYRPLYEQAPRNGGMFEAARRRPPSATHSGIPAGVGPGPTAQRLTSHQGRTSADAAAVSQPARSSPVGFLNTCQARPSASATSAALTVTAMTTRKQSRPCRTSESTRAATAPLSCSARRRSNPPRAVPHARQPPARAR
jgi:hypothetical protein